MLEIWYLEDRGNLIAGAVDHSRIVTWTPVAGSDRGPVYRDHDRRPICVGMTRHAFETWCESFFRALTPAQVAAAEARGCAVLAASVAEIGTHAQLRERYVSLHSS